MSQASKDFSRFIRIDIGLKIRKNIGKLHDTFMYQHPVSSMLYTFFTSQIK